MRKLYTEVNNGFTEVLIRSYQTLILPSTRDKLLTPHKMRDYNPLPPTIINWHLGLITVMHHHENRWGTCCHLVIFFVVATQSNYCIQYDHIHTIVINMYIFQSHILLSKYNIIYFLCLLMTKSDTLNNLINNSMNCLILELIKAVARVVI